MARKFSFGTYDKKHLRNLLRRAQSLADIFGSTANKAAKIGEATGYCDPNGEFTFDKFPSVKERVGELFRGLHDSLLLTITEGNREEWLLSAAKNDAMVDSLFGHVAQYGERAKEWKQPNLKALEAFQNRKERGMDLSERVWNLTNQFKGELELALELGLGDGKSAAALSRDVREYLNEPHKLFRRVRNEKGQLRLSKSAAAYHPGQGVYRSSYKNALRLTATENNMAYRSADHERWQQLDFVIGIEIMLSNNHPCEDICDELAGVYPKTFKFTGWHPFCRCIAVPKLADEDEFIARQQAIIDGQEVPVGGYSGEITLMPEAFNNWVQNNAERIENATNVPYFIRDNRVQVDNILKIKDTVKANVTANTIAAAIEANRREFERLKENPDYIDVAFNASSGGLKATHRGHVVHNKETDHRFFGSENLSSTDLEKLCQKELFEIGKKCILLQENIKSSNGNILPALDAEIEGKLMDIRSITAKKEHYGAALKAKIKQLTNFNKKNNENANTICLYFHDPVMYTEECIERGVEWIKQKFGENVPLKEVWVVIRGCGLKIISI